ncbi:LysR family transcriptional regulator [Nocardia pneumoniae]|uniref:LysR family transcriptional regulator n=1 Tax=Nocardia pneumoniae TaxID=228601 RepID=UPI0014613663|nr:LysR family transcriptional regulator [Nocardia pneumoniae]
MVHAADTTMERYEKHMEMRDIEVFLAVAEELHFRRAARRLYLSTGRVSQTVHALEKELGGLLFTRSSRHVQLTSLGEQFRVDAARGLHQLRSAVARARASADRHNGVLRVGYAAAVEGPLATALATGCQSRHPGVHVVTVAQFTSTGFEPLRQRAIDVLLVWSPGGDEQAVTGEGRVAGPVLATVPRAVLVSGDHPLAARTEVSVEQLADYEILDVHADAPDDFAMVWTPSYAPSGRQLRRIESDPMAVFGHGPTSVLDVMTVVQRSCVPYFTVATLLSCHPYAGLTLVPVSDLPPCVLVPIWHSEFETDTVRAFIDVAVRYRPIAAVDPARHSFARSIT